MLLRTHKHSLLIDENCINILIIKCSLPGPTKLSKMHLPFFYILRWKAEEKWRYGCNKNRLSFKTINKNTDNILNKQM